MAKLSTLCEFDLPMSSSPLPPPPGIPEQQIVQAEAEAEKEVMQRLGRPGSQSPTWKPHQGARVYSPLRDTGCHHHHHHYHHHHRESVSSFAQTDTNYVHRESYASVQSMPQMPCPARTSRSLRRENGPQGLLLPRSPRLCSLSGMAGDTNTPVRRASTSSSIVQVRPLNVEEDDMTKPSSNYLGSSSRTLVSGGGGGATTTVAAATAGAGMGEGGGKMERSRLSWRATLRAHHTDSMFSVLSAPSKISRSTTQHYILTPPSISSLPYTTKEANFMDTKIKKKPSRRGIFNTVTIMAVIFVILFLFAGYPISLHVAKQMKGSEANSANTSENTES
ncbi:hypothetical protein BX666DRAFT_837413 [Dichotomocladium elegans]|nr:hypothetical protein BX666DRAFT_837413 [Dichotomocladium elegans]